MAEEKQLGMFKGVINCSKVVINWDENSVCSSSKATFRIYFLSSLVKTLRWHCIPLALYPFLCLIVFLSWPREVLPVQKKSRKRTNACACFSLKVFHAACLQLCLGVSGVLCVYLMSCGFKHISFSLSGAISIAAGRSGGYLVSPRITKWTLYKWPWEPYQGHWLISVVHALRRCGTSRWCSVLFFYKH